jgi:hypothetical protein
MFDEQPRDLQAECVNMLGSGEAGLQARGGRISRRESADLGSQLREESLVFRGNEQTPILHP